MIQYKDAQEKIAKYKQDWFQKVEKNSTKLLDTAEAAIAQDNTIEKVIILKRFEMFDNASDAVIKIKSDLSKYGNSV